MYKVDCGDHTEIWSSTKVEEYYETEISHNNADGWATFDAWFIDMKRNGLITEVA